MQTGGDRYNGVVRLSEIGLRRIGRGGRTTCLWDPVEFGSLCLTNGRHFEIDSAFDGRGKQRGNVRGNAANRIVQRLWSYCHVLRDDGLSYQDYLKQLTFLLFLKTADERERLTGDLQPIPAARTPSAG